MRSFGDCNPAVIAVYFAAAAGLAMFSMNPAVISVSLAGALLFYFTVSGHDAGMLYTVPLFFVMSLVNPLFSHNGATVLFVMNDNPVTLEALVYGAVASGMIVSVLFWFRCFTKIMTGDRLMYILSLLSHRLALVLSMSVRFVPLYRKQARAVRSSRRALGLCGDSATDSIKERLQIFNILLMWSLENGVITADSMSARGYDTGHRSQCRIFRMSRRDIIILLLIVVLCALTLFFNAKTDFAYYPRLCASGNGAAGCASYGALVLLPAALNFKEALRWKYLKSKI